MVKGPLESLAKEREAKELKGSTPSPEKVFHLLHVQPLLTKVISIYVCYL